MADYTVIPDPSVDPDAPVTSDLAYAFRDNPTAITEGATGAPRIQRAALLGPTAGAIPVFRGAIDIPSSSSAIACRFVVLTPGAVRLSVVSSTGSAGSASWRRLRNGAYTNVTGDVTLNAFDIVEYYASTGAGSPYTAVLSVLIGNNSPAIIPIGDIA